jgi:AraC-like DNA-binding protein
VPPTDDRFACFLDMLAENLDNHALSGAELAARLFVSRSLLDKIVAAAAGETTARLRRRLLLERAAFRLKTTRISVLDAALDAGYSSNEAFTRAFQRAYGSPPAACETYDFAVEEHESINSVRARLATAGRSFATFVRMTSEQDRLRRRGGHRLDQSTYPRQAECISTRRAVCAC